MFLTVITPGLTKQILTLSVAFQVWLCFFSFPLFLRLLVVSVSVLADLFVVIHLRLASIEYLLLRFYCLFFRDYFALFCYRMCNIRIILCVLDGFGQ